MPPPLWDDSYALLRIIGDQLNDIEAVRIAQQNRYRSLTSDEEWGQGVDPTGILFERVAAANTQLEAVERHTVRTLQRAMAAHPLGSWVANQPGIGEKTVARLLGVTGNPAAREMPSQLWAYCGLYVIAGEAPTRRRGTAGNWNDDARKRIWLVAQGTIKATGDGNVARSPFRDVYDGARVKYEEATHERECRRCGPSGQPAAVGSALADGHKHARAVRLVMKDILLDMWQYAQDATLT